MNTNLIKLTFNGDQGGVDESKSEGNKANNAEGSFSFQMNKKAANV